MDISHGSITITETGYTIGDSGTETAYTGEYVITQTDTETATENTITVENGTHNITLSGVNIDVSAVRLAFAFYITSDAEVSVTLEKENHLRSGKDCAGIFVGYEGVLEITQNSTGSLKAIGGEGGAGIGGANGFDGGTVKIAGGIIDAQGGMGGAGIGSGYTSKIKSIHISGGRITAVGGEEGKNTSNIPLAGGAGIGGGSNGTPENIVISGGEITAVGGPSSAGIGGGFYRSGGTITITDAVVTAVGGNSATVMAYGGGAGIGGGSEEGVDSITIKNSVIFAAGGNGAEGLSNGDDIGGGGGTTNFENVISMENSVVFKGTQGTVYGNAVCTKDFTIPANYSLTVPEGMALKIEEGVTLTNEGTIENTGTVENSGTVENNGTIKNDNTISNEGKINNKGNIENNDTISGTNPVRNYNGGNCSGTVDSADWSKEVVVISTAVKPVTGGAVIITEDGVAAEDGVCTKGSLVTVSTVSNEGYHFAEWEKGSSSNDLTFEITATDGIEITAVFAEYFYGNWTGNGDGTHSRSCMDTGCNYSETTDCTGGTATCTTMAECEICGQSYGTVNSSNHTGDTELRDAKEATSTQNGYTGDTYCKACNGIVKKGTVIPATGNGGSTGIGNGGSSGGVSGGFFSGQDTGVTTTTETKEDGTKVETTVETKADGGTVETVVETGTDGSKKETVTETNPDGSVECSVIQTDSKGKVKETVTQTEADGSSVKTTVKKEADGTITLSKATVKAYGTEHPKNTGIEFTITEELMDRISRDIFDRDTNTGADMSSDINTEVTIVVLDKNGNTAYKLVVKTADIEAGNSLSLVIKNKKTGEYTLINDTVYTVSENGDVTISISNKNKYFILNEKDMEKLTEEILETICFEGKKKAKEIQWKTKVGKKYTIRLSDSLNKGNVEKITYVSKNKKIAAVSKKGVIKAKAKGKTVITVKVTLKNGVKKTLKVNVVVK